MNFEKRYRNSQLLFGLSLLFLVGFLSMWLYNIYQDKEDELENQVSFLWLKSVKEVEGKDFSRIVFTAIASNMKGLEQDSIELQKFQQYIGDTTQKSIHNITLEKFETFGEKGNFSFELDSISEQPLGLMFLDSTVTIDIEVDSSEKSPFGVSAIIEKRVSSVLSKFAIDISLVEAKLDSALALQKITIQYEILEPKNSLSTIERSQDKFFVRTATGEQYSLTITENNGYLLGKMWVEFLMSIFLLALISTAFYYLLRNLKEQHQLVLIKNELISNITHELRTPIFTVSAALEALQNFNGLNNPERTKEYLSISQNELNRLSILVEKVLKTSLFEQAVIQINKEEVQLNNLVQSIANSLQLQLEKEGAKLVFNAPLEPIVVFADKIHLTTVLYNLIDNALKYRSEHAPLIQIELKQTEEAVLIRISDNGIGIPKEYLTQIFDKFFRVPQGNQHNVKGYGLGLNYVYNIIQQHGGSIVANSQEGQGSSFLITIPNN